MADIKQEHEKTKKWQDWLWGAACVLAVLVLTYWGVLAWSIESGGMQ